MVVSHHLLEPEKLDLVASDGLPRVARYRTHYSDGTSGETRHVLFLVGALVQTMTEEEWGAALPTDPTPEERSAAIMAREAEEEADRQAAVALRQQILTRAQSAVGVRLDDLTAGQRNALVALLLWQAGALAPDLTVRPLGSWVR